MAFYDFARKLHATKKRRSDGETPKEDEKSVESVENDGSKAKGETEVGTKKEAKVKKKVGSVEELAYSLFGKYYRGKREKYLELEKALLAARYPVTYDIYLSTAFFYALIAGVVGLILGFLCEKLFEVAGFFHWRYAVPPILYAYKEVFISILFAGLGFIALFGATYMIFYFTPFSKAGDRRREIERMMPHAIHFMYALSKSGIGILQIFEALARHSDVYGEVSREIDFVLRNIRYFGKDLRRSLVELSETTPSQTLRDFVSGILTVIESGGNLQIFLAEKAEQYRERAKVEQKGFLETLGLFAEVYITLLVAAPIFFLIVEIIMLAIGSGSMMMIYGVVYLMIPLGSACFIALIQMITPSDVRRFAFLRTEYDVKEALEESPAVRESEAYKHYKRIQARLKMREYAKKPFQKMRENPLLSLALGIPPALFLFTLGEDFLIPAILVAIAPLSFFHELKEKYERRVRNQTPDILNGLSSSVASGLTLMKSIEVEAKAGKGGIYKEIKKMHRNIEWGAEVSDAFKMFANAVKVPALTRVVTMLSEVLRAGGNLTEALSISAKDAEMERNLAKERSVNMLIYVIIVYIAFFVFIGIVYMLFKNLFPPLFEAFSTSGGVGIGAAGLGGGLNKEEITGILTQAAVFQSIFCGLMAGQMEAGNILAGLKHTLVMLLATWILFYFVI